MTVEEFLPSLDAVRSRGASRWEARCPAHLDKSPSLSIAEGKRGILLKCWAGCTLPEICKTLGIEQRELFFDVLDTDPSRRRAAAQHRAEERAVKARIAFADGAAIDALREADCFVRSRRGLDLSQWSDQRLKDELDALATAYHLLESEGLV